MSNDMQMLVICILSCIYSISTSMYICICIMYGFTARRKLKAVKILFFLAPLITDFKIKKKFSFSNSYIIHTYGHFDKNIHLYLILVIHNGSWTIQFTLHAWKKKQHIICVWMVLHSYYKTVKSKNQKTKN